MKKKPKKIIGFQKYSLLFLTHKLLKERKSPMTYYELMEIIKRDYGDVLKFTLKSFSDIRQKVWEDINRKRGKSPFQEVGYRTLGLKEWGYPEFDQDEYLKEQKEKKKAWEEVHKKVSIMAATIEALEKKGEPMRIKEIFEYVRDHDRVEFRTKTPFKTVNSNITHEINKKGEDSRFVRLSKGLIGLSKWYKK